MDREYFNCGELKCYRDWDNEGAIYVENPKTLEKYHQLCDGKFDFEKHGIFFAFGEKQFDKYYAEMIEKGYLTKEDKIYSLGAGAYGKAEGCKAFNIFCKDKKKLIAKECDPQEVYFYEYNNHECMFTDDSDAYAMVEDIFGKKRAKQIQRF